MQNNMMTFSLLTLTLLASSTTLKSPFFFCCDPDMDVSNYRFRHSRVAPSRQEEGPRIMTFGAWIEFKREHEELVNKMQLDRCDVRNEQDLGVLVCYCDNNVPHNCKLTDLQSRCHFVPCLSTLGWAGNRNKGYTYWISFDGKMATYTKEMRWNHSTSSLEIDRKSPPLRIVSKIEACLEVLEKLDDKGAFTPEECFLMRTQHNVRKRCEEVIAPYVTRR